MGSLSTFSQTSGVVSELELKSFVHEDRGLSLGVTGYLAWSGSQRYDSTSSAGVDSALEKTGGKHRKLRTIYPYHVLHSRPKAENQDIGTCTTDYWSAREKVFFYFFVSKIR